MTLTADQTLTALRRRLERWELEHLRSLSAELHVRLERAEKDADDAWRSARYWQGNAEELIQELMEAGESVGITKDGKIGVFHVQD